MGCVTLILPLLLSSIWAAVPDSIAYEGPDTVVRFAVGSGPYEIAIKGEDTITGPCRLIATDTRLYLLDQFNNRVLCYDTAGTFVEQINTPCDAVDVALDSYLRLYFLDNHQQPATVVITEAGEEISRFKVRYDEKKLVNGLVIHPGDSLVFLINQSGFWRITNALDSKGKKAQGIFCLERARYPVTYADVLMQYDGEECSGFSENTEIARKGSNCLPFLEDSSTCRILCFNRTGVHYHKRDSTVNESRLLIFVGNKGCKIISNPPGSYYDTVHWRNVSMDCQGNVYVFDLDSERKACILRWRPLP